MYTCMSDGIWRKTSVVCPPFSGRPILGQSYFAAVRDQDVGWSTVYAKRLEV